MNEATILENCTVILDKQVYSRSLPLIIVGSAIILLTAAIAIIGNFAVVATNILDEALKSQTGNMLVSNLALLDMLTGMFVMVPCALGVIFNRWIFGTYACALHMCINYLCAGGSSVNLALISIDRAIAVLYPLHYPQWVTPTVMKLMCLYVWIHGLTIGCVPMFMGWSAYEYKEAMCSVRWDNTREIDQFITFCMMSCFVVPVSIVFIANIMIIISARKMEKTSVGPSKSDASKSARESAAKTVKSMVVVTALYFICFTPYSAIKQIKALIGSINGINWIDFSTTIIMFFSSAVNPFVYAILRKDYRNAFKKLPRMLKERVFNF